MSLEWSASVPNTGVYAVQWSADESFSSYGMVRVTGTQVRIDPQTFTRNQFLYFRVFAMPATWRVADGHSDQNVTAHSNIVRTRVPRTKSFTYPTGTFTWGTLTPSFPPAVDGADVTDFRLSGALPRAVTFNSSTGIFSGPQGGYFNATGVSAGFETSCAIDSSNNGVRCWGRDGIAVNDTTPKGLESLSTGISQVSAGNTHSCVRTSSGGAKCWGANSVGQLGNGTTTSSGTAVDVSGLTSGVASVAASVNGRHTCAALTDGTVSCWGENAHGQLGDGTTTNRNTPVVVSGLSGVSAVAVGSTHSCALKSSGAVECWGQNTVGQLGDGSTTSSSVPVAVPSLTSGVSEIAVGQEFSCARLTAGGVKCWGANHYKQLGDGTLINRITPVDVCESLSPCVALANVSQLSAASVSACVVTSAGGVKCWGSNEYGQGGTGSTTGANDKLGAAMEVVGAATGFSRVAVGGFHACAGRNSDGLIRCWGRNEFGQLGNGSTALRSPTPTDVIGTGNEGFESRMSVTVNFSDGESASADIVLKLTPIAG